MKNNTQPVLKTLGNNLSHFWFLLVSIVFSCSAWAGYQDIDLNNCLPDIPENVIKLSAEIGMGTPGNPLDCTGPLGSGCEIGTVGVTGGSNVYWEYSDFSATEKCLGSPPTFDCAGISVTLPGIVSDINTTGPVSSTSKVTLTAPSAGLGLAETQFYLKLSDENGTKDCKRRYRFRVTSTGGGWGDPHITTVDGIHYDFQGAGEFVALRGNGIEIQTRQTPVATASVPSFTNAYTGLRSCVSLYTAVAARVGSHRVTYQPNISGDPDPSGMQLRVDGVLTTLGPDGITLEDGEGSTPIPAVTSTVVTQPAGNRIVKSPEGDGIEIHYTNGTKLVATPAWWAAQQKWYLNVNVYETTASQGIMGQIAQESWLPALADGSSVGPKPESIHDRYDQLYEKFGNSWRVTDTTSLFDYAPGTSTSTFTLADWPRENPKTCSLEGQPEAQAIDVATAEKECSGVVGENNKANCVFDVAVTGETGFARTYVLSEKLAPGATKTTLVADKASSKQGESVTFTATVAHTVKRAKDGNPSGKVQFIADGSNAGNPVAIDATGKAVWTTSSLQAGAHSILAKYNPTRGFGERFLASTSSAVSLTVAATPTIPLWLLILLIIIILAIIIWWLMRGK